MNKELQIGNLVTIPDEMFMETELEEDNENALGYIRNIRPQMIIDHAGTKRYTGKTEYEVVWLDEWARQNEPEMIQWHTTNWLELYKNK